MGFDLIAVAFLFFLGLAVGSHVNVIVLRYGFKEESSVRSLCAQCGETIAWYDLVPVLSYLALQGRCRACGSGISRQYPLVELFTGCIFALMYFLYTPALTILGFVGFFALLLFWASLIALVAYDVRHTLVPLPFVFALTLFALLYRVLESVTLGDYLPLVDALIGAGILFVFFYAVYFITKGKGMGIGDAYVAIGIGVLLGAIDGVSAAVLGVWAGTVFYVLLYALSQSGVLRRFRVTMKTELPFAPWLALGTLLVLTTPLSPFWFGEQIMKLWGF